MTESVSITHHRPSRSFLFFSFVILVVLMQRLVLGWGAEAVVFVTWLLVALIVQHDSRLSAAAGLVFLATCPFLLIAEKEAVAEQAANYAYFSLAIGVLVQLEELVLVRYGWLVRKLDLSYLWHPITRQLRYAWSTAAMTLENIMVAADRNTLVRPIQILGTTCLAVASLWAAFSGARLSVVLPLVGGAVLFPFVVWGLWFTLRALGPARLLRALVVLLLLLLAALEMVWLYDLATADRLARLEVSYDFIERFDETRRTSPTPEGEIIEAKAWTILGETKRVLYQHPALSGSSWLACTIEVGRGSVLSFDVATDPGSWEQPGDGVTFAVYVVSDRGTEQVFSTYIDPKRDPESRRWHPYALELSEYADQTVSIIFETGAGPVRDYRYDWAGWGAPRLLEP